LKVLDQAIGIEEENNKSRTTKSLLLGRMYYCRATIMQSMKNYTESKKDY
jgi:hypothetical protein